MVFKISLCPYLCLYSYKFSVGFLQCSLFYSGIKSDNARHSTQVRVLKTPILTSGEEPKENAFESIDYVGLLCQSIPLVFYQVFQKKKPKFVHNCFI